MDQHHSSSKPVRSKGIAERSLEGNGSDRDLMPTGSVPGAQPPIESEVPRQTRRRDTAAGVSAIVQTTRYIARRMGVVRGASALLQVNKIHGFDCQSCAWPSPDDHRHLVELCENGAKAISDEGTLRRVTPEFFAKYSVQELLKKSDFWLNEQGRLTHPMILRDGSTHYEPISWDDAFSLLAEELNRLDSPHQAAFYTSGRTSNEAAYLYQLFARQFGTNNLPDCSNLCHESSSAALSETIGIGKGTVTLHDFDMTDAIFIVGQNPGTNHPRMLTSLEQAKRHGAKIVSINPLPETGAFRFKNPRNPVTALAGGTRLSDLWLPVKVNGDLALFKGIMKEMLAAEDEKPGSVFDHDFIRRCTFGFEPFIDSLRTAPWEPILAGSGLTRDQIRQAAQIAIQAKRIICCWAMGLTQHRNAVATVREIVNFLLLRGNIGRPGTGPCPVGGHSNAQGDRTMGIWEQPSPEFLDKLAERYQFEPPREAGADVVETIKAMHRRRIKVFFALGGNFLSATPDTDFTAEALQNCRLTAHVSTKLNRAHLITGRQALILPCLGRLEIDEQKGGHQFVTVEDSMGVINASRGRLTPASEHLLSEPAIVARLAQEVLKGRSQLPWQQWMDDYSTIRDEIESVIPGFNRFNERIAEHVFYLPNGPRDKQEFKTNTGKANFTVNDFELFDLPPGFFVLTTIRSQDQFNTTIYGLDDRYRGIYNSRRVLFMNPEDMGKAGFQQGQPVDITSHFEGREREAQHFLVAPYSIPRQCVATYFPEGNVLVPIGSVAEISNTPTSKSIIVTLTPSPNVEAVRTELFAEVAEAKRLPTQIVAGTARLMTKPFGASTNHI
jgi:molybdopterin-dependent oxidoreductase alpha subunit